MIGANHQDALATLVERKTGCTRIAKVARKTPQAVSQMRIELLKPYQP